MTLHRSFSAGDIRVPRPAPPGLDQPALSPTDAPHRRNVEDAAHNTTRFYIMAKTPHVQPPSTPNLMTTFIFRVRNVPAALYKALGGFATNGVNMTKLESYMVDGEFTATQFYAEVDGHPEDPGLSRALDELGFFSRELRVIGTYAAHPFREAARPAAE